MALFRLVAAATTNATLIKAGRTRVRKVIVSNSSATVHHLKIYDKATAPSVGTDVPVLTLYTGINSGKTTVFNLEPGIELFSGLGISINGGATSAADADNTAATASVCIVHVIYD